MVGRYGGEEFLVILNRCEPANARARSDDLRMSFSGRPIPTRGEALTVTISVGLALSTDFPSYGVDEIIQAADAALYEAKAGGRNCVRVACPGAGSSSTDIAQKEVMAISK
jgi:diguanylate cyclase (GGDEF)-like protein